MPVTYVHIKWPNKQTDKIYSPSSVIEEYFNVGETLGVNEFLLKCNEGLAEASERVRKKFGYACTSAQAESLRITTMGKTFEASKKVEILSIK